MSTVPLLSVSRTSRPTSSMRAMSPKRAMKDRPRSSLLPRPISMPKILIGSLPSRSGGT
jgi:hypothetical protein